MGLKRPGNAAFSDCGPLVADKALTYVERSCSLFIARRTARSLAICSPIGYCAAMSFFLRNLARYGGLVIAVACHDDYEYDGPDQG